MASLDKEAVKKHHFWFLLIPVAIGLLLAWIGLFFGVADATAAKSKSNSDEKGKIDSAKAQPRKMLDKYEEKKGVLFDLRSKRWEEMWDLQKTIYTLPEELGPEPLAIFRKYRFGDNITEQSLLAAFREHYAKGYETVAKSVEPIQFNNNWPAIFRHVPEGTWKRLPEPEDVWLALEDYWVQREIVTAFSKVNQDAAKFYTPKDFPEGHWMRGMPDTPTKRAFLSRLWYLELEIVEVSGGRAIKGKIRNATNRLLPFGINNELTLEIYLSDSPDARPFIFGIEGVSMEAGKTEEIKYIPRKHQIFDQQIKGLIRVKQKFDIRSAPVKRVEKISLGYLSARHSDIALQMSSFSKKNFDKESEATATDPNAATTGTVSAPPGGGETSGFPGMPGAGAQAASKDLTYNGLTRKRYLNRTDQVRGMPAAATVLVDQNFVQDVITAMANCKLRFQIVQVHNSRFRGTLSYSSSNTSTPGTGSTPGLNPGIPPKGSGSEEEEGGAVGSSTVGPRGGGSSSAIPPKGPGGVTGPPGFPGGSTPGFPGGSVPGFPGGESGFPGFPGGAATGAPRSSVEDNVATNLIELSVYGLATLYEKFVAEKKDETATPPGNPTEAPMPMNPPMPSSPGTTVPGKSTEPGPMPKEQTPTPKTETPPMKEAPPPDMPPKM